VVEIENYKLTAKTVYLFLKNASIQNLCTKKLATWTPAAFDLKKIL
jgi:hypothetical protein